VISEKTAAQLGPLREFVNAKNYPAALGLLAPLLTANPADSYDTFVLSQVQAQIHLAQSRYADALPPLETSLRLADAHPFLDARPKLDLVYLMAQVAAQLAAEEKSPDLQRTRLARAADLIRRWLTATPAPTTEARLFSASVLFNLAQTTPPGAGDQAKNYSAALAEAEQGLLLGVHPNEQFYVLILACHQQLGNLDRAADVLELLVQQHPSNASYWQQLTVTCLNLAAAGKATDSAHPRLGAGNTVRHAELRALLALERAQTQGFLTTSADTFNLAGLHYNLGQFDRALALLEPDLADGAIAPDRRSWELFVHAGQQAHQSARVLATLEKTAVRLPSDGPLAYALAQLCYAEHQLEAARTHAQSALARGGLDRPVSALLFLATVNYELNAPDNAIHALDQAAQLSPNAAEADDLARLRRALALMKPKP
ncbi:MAG: tetratricopeptide repeat protein, partial [Verrucomicrobiota bacterium]